MKGMMIGAVYRVGTENTEFDRKRLKRDPSNSGFRFLRVLRDSVVNRSSLNANALKPDRQLISP